MTNSSHDEKLIQLKDEFGMEGYGVYWTILELISAQISAENQQNFVELSMKSWRKVTELSPKKFQKFVTFCEKNGLFFVENSAEKIKVGSPNILKYKDEHTRKSGVTSKPNSGVTPDTKKELEVELEEEQEIETEKEKNKPPDFTDQDLINAGYLLDKILAINPNHKKPNLKNWAKEFRKIREIDKRGQEEITELINWVFNNDFWKSNILSPGKLRIKFDDLTVRKITDENRVVKFQRPASDSPMPKEFPLDG